MVYNKLEFSLIHLYTYFDFLLFADNYDFSNDSTFLLLMIAPVLQYCHLLFIPQSPLISGSTAKSSSC